MRPPQTDIYIEAKRCRKIFCLTLILVLVFGHVYAEDTEVLPKTNTKVLVREHPKTGEPYVAVISASEADRGGPFAGMKKISIRPDYRMLDPKIKSGTIPYEGPYSSRKKVYVFAASMAALGIGGAALLPVASVTGAGATGGAGALAGAGAGVAAGTAGAVAAAKRQDPEKKDDFTNIAKSESGKGDRS
ncbi:MAG: hypothetical protein HYZ83_03330 [Candidatus Omnitrophica bacterium]|nr:hypothetical protein [Candidatus Omnitrophota bacterium]